MAAYRHVITGKDELLELMVDHVYGELEPPAAKTGRYPVCERYPGEAARKDDPQWRFEHAVGFEIFLTLRCRCRCRENRRWHHSELTPSALCRFAGWGNRPRFQGVPHSARSGITAFPARRIDDRCRILVRRFGAPGATMGLDDNFRTVSDSGRLELASSLPGPAARPRVKFEETGWPGRST
ncbi:hypothetical protein ACFWWA_06840 [Streptomyces goshikiensis]|uniref:hypothetical protein n=1 Tax=Streptomyces goshikiensis TaxID=1942 RepID=UPI003667788B